VDVSAGRIAIHPSAAEGLQEVRVGVRPEAIQLAAPGTAPGESVNALSGTVADTAFLGSGFHLTIDIGENRVMSAVTNGSILKFAQGADVLVTWAVDDTLVVPDSGPSDV
jgi:hypothetical protein